MKIDYSKANKAEIFNYTNELKTKNDNIESIFKKERELYKKDFQNLIQKLRSKDVEKFYLVQGDALVLSDEISDKITNYLSDLSKYRPNYKQSLADRFEYYVTGFNIKIADTKKTLLIDRDLSENQRRCEIYEVHLEHLRELRKKCSDVQFALKNRIDLMNLIQKIV